MRAVSRSSHSSSSPLPPPPPRTSRSAARRTGSRTSRPRRSTAPAYGYGYALAQDNLCEIAETYVTVNGERSRFFGPDGELRDPRQRGDVQQPQLGLLLPAHQGRPGRREAARAAAAATARCPRSARASRGYVGRLQRLPAPRSASDGIPDPRCRGKAWVRPITEIDAYRRFYQLALLASSGVAIDGIAQAQPPTPARGSGPASRAAGRSPGDLGTLQDRLPLGDLGSNAVALGKEATDDRQRACCSATRTSRGTGPSASTRRTSRSPARSTSPARRCSACR